MIIIKSQTGTISKLVSVEFDDSKTAIFGYTDMRCVLLGQEYSEKRAKEVMAEIEEHIRHLGFYKIMAKSSNVEECASFLGFNDLIYTMPKV